MIFLGDQPDLRTEVMAAVFSLYAETGGPVVRAEYRGTLGHPVIIDRSIWGKICSSAGDRGAGPVLARHPEWVVPAPIDLPPPSEVDTPEDFQALITGDPETT
jgi:molybdenum cofactor cytidylyltransferase